MSVQNPPLSRVRHLSVSAAGTALETVISQLDFERERTRKLFDLGSVYLNKKRLFADTAVQEGDYLRVHTEPRRYERPGLAPRRLHEDENYVVFDKPGGVPCHATVDNGRENILSWWSEESGHPALITHRLDIGTSGCLVVARSPDAASRFNRLILKGRMVKEYEAIVEGAFERTGTFVHWMVDGLWAPREVRDEPFEGALECRLRVLFTEVLRQPETLLEVTRLRLVLETGRTHQIRVQMAALGHPVLNDTMYGARRCLDRERIALCASQLSYRDPFSGDERKWVAPSGALEGFPALAPS